jgi:hypothetical protein
LQEGRQLLQSFFDIRRGGSVNQWREFGENLDGKAHLLMRPIRLLALATAIGWLHHNPNGPRKDLDEIFAITGKRRSGPTALRAPLMAIVRCEPSSAKTVILPRKSMSPSRASDSIPRLLSLQVNPLDRRAD